MERTVVEHVRAVAVGIVAPTLELAGRDHSWTTGSQVHTEDDARAGAELERRLLESFPDHGMGVEDRPPVAGDGRHVWHVDPIDGSANHLRGIPYVAISVGLERDGELVLGVVHDVVRDQTLSAHLGGGARRSGAATGAPRVSAVSDLDQAMAVLHLARRGPLLNVGDALHRLLWRVRKVRCMGSVALDLALVADGTVDLLVAGRGSRQRLLDLAGGLVVLREAGGLATASHGGAFDREQRTLVAGNPSLVAAFVELMADLDLEGWEAGDALPH